MSVLWRVVWKECREQLLFWLAIAALTVIVVMAVAAAFGPPDIFSAHQHPHTHNVLTKIILIMGVTFAIVCSAFLFAGEREGGTQAFLDVLPVSRARLWTVKVVAGSGLVLAQTVVLLALAAAFRLTADERNDWNRVLTLAIIPLGAFGCGLCGSVLCRSVLAGAGLGAVFLAIEWTLALLATMFHPALFVALYLLLTAGAAIASRKIYCNLDRLRRKRTASASAGVSSWRVLTWLCWRQGRLVVAGLILAIIPFAALFPSYGLLVYPAATLLFGVACGIAVFAGEQSGGVNRFLGEQRFSPCRIWLAKSLFWLAILVGCSALLFVIGAVICFLSDMEAAYSIIHFRSDPLSWMQRTGVVSQFIDPAVYVCLWPLTGFALGLLCSPLFRKPIVAAFLATALGVMIAAAWLPSLLVGALYSWTVFVPVVILFLTSGFSMRAWMSNRFNTLRPSLFLFCNSVFIILWIAGNLWYRVAEIPDVGAPFDVRQYRAEMNRVTDSPAGLLLRKIADDFSKRDHALLSSKQESNGKSEIPDNEEERKKADYKRLDLLFQGKWLKSLEKAVRSPPGNVRIGVGGAALWKTNLPFLGHMLVERALQQMERGEAEQAVDLLLTSLRLSLYLRHKATILQVNSEAQTEKTIYTTFEKWLNKRPENTKLLRALLAGLQEHEKNYLPLADVVKSSLVKSQDDRPEIYGQFTYADNKREKPEHALHYFARHVPWEKERERRLTNLLVTGQLHAIGKPPWQRYDKSTTFSWHDPERIRQELALGDGDNPAGRLSARRWDEIFESSDRFFCYLYLWSVGLGDRDTELLRQLRLLQLRTAHRLYEVDNHRPPPDLNALVPHYLPAIPIDPTTGEPFSENALERDNERP